MRTFGSIVHVKDIKGHLSKLEDRSKPMIFIAYELGSKAYKCLDLVNFKVIISRDVIFEEAEKWTWSTQGETHIHSPSYLTFSLIKHRKIKLISRMKKRRSLLR